MYTTDKLKMALRQMLRWKSRVALRNRKTSLLCEVHGVQRVVDFLADRALLECGCRREIARFDPESLAEFNRACDEAMENARRIQEAEVAA
jgi:hypothetical protein